MKIDISQDDFGALCICAIRYCMRRQTYMPGLIQDIIRTHFLRDLSDRDISAILVDCKMQEKNDSFGYGDPIMDKPGWVRFRKDLEEEHNRRKNND